ncbi:hypothetical protein SPRG_20291 [Saprolegnia parasitica CBS 223.65]|uniref:Uncharacterized protein n=1 Tax=Saprolegnia parasitica (strain CBS 223.65) TaxID=695850 RepID=A0A067CNM4_SAPPC|nr:hypothetical protein SPRG_20291 [Saprolegnia parasitica CBS 223.65]KDO28131.1 hypothetical protein SPRG_20291 [Saprolegnia parasitica CBS 223.65]|eukprot:XP_012201269.1 hypothetical protein SPRG_20291 [Saprolegnia parasitica CBS 223.65]
MSTLSTYKLPKTLFANAPRCATTSMAFSRAGTYFDTKMTCIFKPAIVEQWTQRIKGQIVSLATIDNETNEG